VPDFPDFSQYAIVNLYQQTLSELISRNKYGAPAMVVGRETVEEDETKTMLDITGKGQIYAAVCNVIGQISATDHMILAMDGQVINDMTWDDLFSNRYLAGMNLPIGMTRYPADADKATASLTPGYTFETQYKLEYHHGELIGNGSVNVVTIAYYALIGP